MTDWTETTIGKIAEIYDGPHATPEKIKSGPWFLSISSLVDGRLDLRESAHLSEGDYVKWTRRVVPQSGDVLFSYETRLGDAALMPDGIRACLGRRMALLRARSSRVLPRFLLYAYLAPGFQQTIRQRAVHGATVDRISLADLPDWPIVLPSLREQQAISDVLGALDDKVVANSVSMRGVDELLDCEFLLATRGSLRELRLYDVVEFKYGRALPEAVRAPGPVPVYGGNGISGSHSTSLLEGPGIVVGRKGANAGSVSWSARPFWPIDTAFYVERVKIDAPWEFVYFLLRNAGLRGLVGDSAIPGLNRDIAYSASVFLPDDRAINKFSRAAEAFMSLQGGLAEESTRLIRLRDILLPNLMCGRIRIKDAEKKAEALL